MLFYMLQIREGALLMEVEFVIYFGSGFAQISYTTFTLKGDDKIWLKEICIKDLIGLFAMMLPLKHSLKVRFCTFQNLSLITGHYWLFFQYERRMHGPNPFPFLVAWIMNKDFANFISSIGVPLLHIWRLLRSLPIKWPNGTYSALGIFSIGKYIY